jgi:lipopolysaccharide/colanic/teichoic acid biosynthesis glycosyltransferase
MTKQPSSLDFHGTSRTKGEPPGATSPSCLHSRLYVRFGKRALDVLMALAALLVLGPFILIMAAIVALDGHWPFFAHRRVGRHGVEFSCLKIRSMVPDAEQKLAAILEADPAACAEWERDWKLTDDPRVTRIGKFLRRTSLDELPQLWNILQGEMSFVGPRPVTAVELLRYGRHAGAYIEMRPGLTGLWQVDGRNDVAYDQRVALDVKYQRIVSFKWDVSIIFATALAVARLTGR